MPMVSSRGDAVRIAAIYDIHGNLPALDAVLEEIDVLDVDLIMVGGDLAAGPLPRETLDRLMSLGSRARFIRGNADREVAASNANLPGDDPDETSVEATLAWTAGAITPSQREFLATLPENVVIDVDGIGAVLFCHASPRNDTEIFTEATPETRMREILSDVDERTIVCGHTHMQFDRQVGEIRVVNAGSVGMPYEGTRGAYWLLLGPGIEFKHTLYDVERAAEAIRGSGYPGAGEFAAGNVFHPPTRAEALAIFEGMAARPPKQ
jgi:putative phosphoesterase